MPGTLEYQLEEDKGWEIIDLAEESIQIRNTDPCKEYEIKIKINEEARTLSKFGTFKTNQASVDGSKFQMNQLNLIGT